MRKPTTKNRVIYIKWTKSLKETTQLTHGETNNLTGPIISKKKRKIMNELSKIQSKDCTDELNQAFKKCTQFSPESRIPITEVTLTITAVS